MDRNGMAVKIFGQAALGVALAGATYPLGAATAAERGKLMQMPLPLGSPGGWATNSDYPEKSRRAAMQGTASFSLTVGESGKVLNCSITNTSGDQLLDIQTCRVMLARAKFGPARDMQGQPIASVFRSRVRWAIDSGDPVKTVSTADIELVVARLPDKAPKIIETGVIVDASGKVEACAAIDTKLPEGLAMAVCNAVTALPMPRAVDTAKKPIRVLRPVSVKLVLS
jgi:TonB family protein